MKKRKSIRIRLLEVYVVIMLLVFAINMYIVHSQSQAIRQIDGVYNSNIQLNDISTTLEKMQTSLYQYLNTKSSDELENYYLYEQDYRNLISELNEETVNDQNLLMEKNIRNMSDTYLEKTAGAIEAKRGRNVSCYNEEYSKAKKLYDYLDNNPECMSAPVDYTNDVRVIAGLDNFISINNAVDIDLFGQVNSESAGIRHISGAGGQLDFVMGAYLSHGGKSFICCSSSFTSKDGQLHSRIVPTLTQGSIVTDTRANTQYLVTEYGMVNLKGLNTWQRTEAIISIAHPNFRDDLIKEAEKMKIWRRSNKI